MGLETTMGEVFPCWHGSTFDLGTLAATSVVKMRGQRFTFCRRYVSSASVMKLGM